MPVAHVSLDLRIDSVGPGLVSCVSTWHLARFTFVRLLGGFVVLADEIRLRSSQVLLRMWDQLDLRRFSLGVAECCSRADGVPLAINPSRVSVCASPQEAMACWREHFAALEAGELVQPDAFVSACVHEQRQRLGPECISPKHWPKLGEVEQALRLVAPDRAEGPDGIPTRICRTFCNTLFIKIFPLILKTVALSCEAVGHKGGTLFRLAKPGGDASKCSGYRGVLAQNALAKVAQKVTRGMLTDRLEEDPQPFRLGGRKGYCAGFGSLMVRCFLKYARRIGMSGGVVFVDIVSAYYCVVRQLICGSGGQQFRLEEVVRSVGLEPEDLQKLQRYVQHDPVLADADAEVLRGLAREFHSHTWQVLHEDSCLTWTQKGSRPGSSWADCIFSVLFTRIMKRREVDFKAAVRPAIPWISVARWHPVSRRTVPVCGRRWRRLFLPMIWRSSQCMRIA